jgi:integrase
VRVYGGIDPLTKRQIYLRETIPPGPRAEATAEKTLTRLQNQVDEKRHPRTSATINQLLDKYLEVVEIDGNTRRSYVSILRKHVRPLLGRLKAGQLADQAGVEILESFYAELRRCRDHCDGKPRVHHRTAQDHDCDPHPKTTCSPSDPECRHCRRMCRPHICKPLGKSGIRQAHWILSGALASAVRWGWIGVNAADHVKRPEREPSKPQPPAAEDAASLINEAARRDPDWGAFVWVITTTGARRGEMCGLRLDDLELSNKVIHLHHAIGVDNDGSWYEKDTKSHQQRRVVIDDETVDVLREHVDRCRQRAAELGIQLQDSAYVFSREPSGSKFLIPDSVSQRYDRMAKKLGIKTTLHKLRHYSATELLSAGVDIRTVAGRLGHGGGGATTLRVYAAWLSEADQRAATALSGRMPARSRRSQEDAQVSAVPEPDQDVAEPGPYVEIANDLRGAIRSGALRQGDNLPTTKKLAARYGVAVSTVHRAVQVLKADGLVISSRGRRSVVV